MKKKWTTGKVVGLVFGITGGAVILFIAFTFSIYQLIEKIIAVESTIPVAEQEYNSDDYEDDEDYKNDSDDEWWSQGEYYDFHDEIRDDLSYKISFDIFDYTCTENHNIKVEFSYPTVSGEVPNLDGINAAIQEELDIVVNYADEWADLEEDAYYDFNGEGYITYMDENILSVAYLEYGYLNGERCESYIASINIDMETGMPMSNSQLIDMNDEFSIEFRKRCEKQNGEIEGLSELSDQEITEYLKDPDYVIILYTPMGMEVGFNFPGGWATVTYTDYSNFQKHI